MNVGLYVVYDKVSKLAGPVFQAQSAENAKRMVMASLHDKSVLVQFPDDYTLIHVADFDQIDVGIMHVEQNFVCSVRSLIPEKFRQFDLTGGADNETPSKSSSEKS